MYKLTKPFSKLKTFYLVKSKDGKFHISKGLNLLLCPFLHVPYFAKFFKKHIEKIDETKKNLKSLSLNSSLLKKVNNYWFFSGSTFRKLIISLFETSNEKAMVELYSNFDFENNFNQIPLDPFYDKSSTSSIQRLLLYKYVIDLEKIKNDPELIFLKSIEILSKRIVNRELKENTIIPQITYAGKRAYYKVYKSIFSKRGMVGYALSPLDKSNPPIIVFRGTQGNILNREAIYSILDDMRPKMASQGFLRGKKILNELFNDPNFLNKKAIVVGFSLGGGYAQRTSLSFADKVGHLITFNSIGLDEKSIVKFSNLENVDIKITVIRNKGDIADLLGYGHIGKKIDNKAIYYLYNKPMQIPKVSIFNFFKALLGIHKNLHLCEDPFIEKHHDSNELDNLHRNNLKWEKFRRFFSIFNK